MMKAVHFGAGNIGRGFVGLLLHEGGYELVFADVASALVDAINAAEDYTVHEVGEGGRNTRVTGFRAINSATAPEALVAEIADADLVTTAAGPNVLPFVAAPIVDALRRRSAASAPLQVMACENAIGATDTLRAAVADQAGAEWDALSRRAVFANTAVDRIVPGQPAGGGIDVTVEPFFEWAIERAPFGDSPPRIPGAHFVDDLAPYIERKLFTVNTGHATTAYLGAQAGIERISDALADDGIRSGVSAALAETSALLAAVHGFDPEDLAAYRATILHRFANPALPDTVWRVGRQPVRKLSRHERFVGPAARGAELGLPTTALVRAIAAALAFDDPADEQSVELQRRLRTEDAISLATSVTGLQDGHPLFPAVRDAFVARADTLSARGPHAP